MDIGDVLLLIVHVVDLVYRIVRNTEKDRRYLRNNDGHRKNDLS